MGHRLLSGKHGPRIKTDQTSRSDLKDFSFVDSGSQSVSQKDSDVFFHADAGGIANKGSASDNVQISKPKYNMDDRNWSEEEEGAGETEDQEVLARMVRSPQEFDDDVEMSSSEEKGNRGRGKAKGRGNGNGKGKGNKKEYTNEN